MKGLYPNANRVPEYSLPPTWYEYSTSTWYKVPPSSPGFSCSDTCRTIPRVVGQRLGRTACQALQIPKHSTSTPMPMNTPKKMVTAVILAPLAMGYDGRA